MAVLCANGSASIVRLSFKITEFPAYLQRGLNLDVSTPEVERAGRELVLSAFSESLTADFVRKVCYWGGYAGIAGKVLKRNPKALVAATMKRAFDLTQQGDLKGALIEMLRLNGFAVSFASKHLKFLDPDRHVVLDSIISERLGYPRTIDGYVEFVADCAAMLDAVQSAGVTRPDGQPFRIADVEMAIFQFLRSQEQ